MKRLLHSGLCVTINSDDPAYFGGYMTENFVATADALRLSKDDLVQITKNSIAASFADEARKNALLAELDKAVKTSV